jgi:hypothetical protein
LRERHSVRSGDIDITDFSGCVEGVNMQRPKNWLYGVDLRRKKSWVEGVRMQKVDGMHAVYIVVESDVAHALIKVLPLVEVLR